MSIVLHGVAAGKGIAIGQAHLITRGTAEVPQYDVSDDLIDAEAAITKIGRASCRERV